MRKTLSEGKQYLEDIMSFLDSNAEFEEHLEVFLIPTFLSIDAFTRIIKDKKSLLKIGAQNCCWEDEGAFTGEVSPMHLKEIGTVYVEIGHPERKKFFNEDNEMINKKILAALKNKLKPILCIGEEKKYTDTSITQNLLSEQLMSALKNVKQENLSNIILAYEPAWAIGVDTSAPIRHIEESLNFLRRLIDKNYGNTSGDRQIIIYGGSVNMENVKEILSIQNNNGIFIGRAALDEQCFKEMIKIAYEIKTKG